MSTGPAPRKSLPILEQRSALRSDGGRNFVVPADVQGRFTRLRKLVFTILIGVYVALPWLQVRGKPAVFLDLQHRAFYLFGATFNAQDVWMVFFLLSGVGFLLILATALWGRIWCGYACPQTVFLEGVYRRLERLIEGPRNRHLLRDRSGLSFDRIWRKVLKHSVFIAVSFLVAHVFLSYFVSIPALFEMMTERPHEHPEAFAWAFGMTAVMYFNYAWFREQLCIVICPYGRLQSVLSDADTVVIGYDTARGEPRGKVTSTTKGDCVDCARCVVVCPTGIDIRNGLQLDCIGCAACVDACDEVMEKLDRPKGLVRYDSLNGLAKKPKRFLRGRVYLYALLGVLGLVVATFSLQHHVAFEANLLRLQGAPYLLEAERVRNALELHVVNKRGEPVTFKLAPAPGQDLTYVLARTSLTLAPFGEQRVPVFVLGPHDRKPRKVRIQIDDGKEPRIIEGAFVAPR
jgi:cytochrome c oxidase accessory protein FixG